MNAKESIHPIPIEIIEEHNEAYYIWWKAVEEGILPPTGNTLFHIDHHDDMECGGYFWDFTTPFTDLAQRERFTYEKLGIADFIAPALFEGLFQTFYNMKALIPIPFQKTERFVHLKGTSELQMGNYIPLLHSTRRKNGDSTYRFFDYYEGSLTDTPPLKSVVLDIDLDYFCWDDTLATVPPKRMEITKEAYQEYQTDRYHPFRIIPKRMIFAEEENEHYYLRYQEVPGAHKETTEEQIKKRATRFLDWLAKQPWTPTLITLCRSAHSGYLPSDKAVYVEKVVREGLM
jgi:hypothetical protein